MSWVLTSEGQVVALDAPLANPGALTITAIAHSLAMINRFTGHTVRPYSVAEHSLLVCDIVEHHLHLGVHAQLAALMHDAHECITNDLSTPAKAIVGDGWRSFEADWEHGVHTLYALRLSFDAFGPAIRHADLIALATERRDLMHPGGPAWPSLHGIEPLQGLNLRDRDGFAWDDWRQAFLDRYHELDFARNDMHHCRTTP